MYFRHAWSKVPGIIDLPEVNVHPRFGKADYERHVYIWSI